MTFAPLQMLRLHATCVAFGDQGVLLRGPSGAGKSDLALRLMCQPVTAPAGSSWRRAMPMRPCVVRLVADDQVVVWPHAGRLMATAPSALAGKLEVRGLGIIEVEPVHDVPVGLVVDLVPASVVDRMPDQGRMTEIQNIAISVISLGAFEAAACIKVALALAHASPIFRHDQDR